MKTIFILPVFTVLLACQNGQVNKVPQPLVIAFASCSNQNMYNPMWQPIAQHKPEVFIWLGDNIYGDSNDLDTLKEAYAIMNRRPEYLKFKAGNIHIIGTWDDHDYGQNDAGKEWAIKDGSKKLMLDFLEIPENAEVRNREGVYQSFTFGETDYEVKVILLDTRYFRDRLTLDTAKNKVYAQNPTGDMLGEAQWKWLENELKVNPAEITIIGSSIQFLADEHGWERWGELPAAQNRFLNLIEKYQPKNLLILSGDRHIAEVSQSEVGGQVFYDITSSGMTHVYYPAPDSNRFRISPFITSRNWGLLTINWATPKKLITVEIRGEADSLFYKGILKPK